MKNVYADAATQVYNDYVRAWKEEGKKIIGYTCSYVPEEIFHAAGMLPFRLGGMDATAHDISDTYFGPFICSMPKSILQMAGEGRYKFLDGMIVIPACDSMRRIDECWRKADKDIGGILPSFFFHYGVPHKVSPYSIKWLEDETERLVQALEDHFSVRITEEALKNSIQVYNKGRRLLKRIDEMRWKDKVPLSGTDALAMVLAGRAMPREKYNGLLEGTIKELEAGGESLGGKKRILLAGSANDDLNLVKIIEDEGAVVVADTVCYGSRFYSDLVDEDMAPLPALVRRYLSHESCPRMIGKYQERLAVIKQKAEKARVDGVVLQNIRFCDLHGSENSIIGKDLEAMGIPCLKIEREYGPLSDSGRIRLRVNAFLEILDKRKEMI